MQHIHTSDQEVLNLGVGNCSCNWGTHICGLYETEEERDDIIFGILAAGIGARDREFYVPNERSREDFIEKFSLLGEAQAEYVRNPDGLSVVDARSLYYPDGTFSPKAMDKGLQAVFDASQANGKRFIRSGAEMTWALEAIPGIETLMVYESRLNYMIPGKPWVTICMYNVTKFSGSIIMDVLRNHPFTISNKVVLQNPYYQPPEVWLAKNAPEFLKRHLD